VPTPGPGSVVVRTTIAGVCGTDAHRLDGDLPDPGRPVTFGHEGIGAVEELGAGVSTDSAGIPLAVGDTVYWSPSSREPGVPSELGWPPSASIPTPAAYQDFATLPPTNLWYRVDPDTDPLAVIAFGCAMPTVLAALSPARQVIVIGAPDVRLAAAERLGASTTIALERTSAEERLAMVQELTDGRGADVVIEATGRMEAFPEGMSLLAPGGRYVVLGIYSGQGTVAFDPVRLNNHSMSIIGSMGATRTSDYRTTIQLAHRHGERLGFADLVTHRFPLSQLEAAIDVARRGEAIKAVVLPGLDA
jgi:threonine dehydrogenase-like Zn-dependent dehydrogenase